MGYTTLLEAAKYSTDPVRKKIIELFVKETDVLRVLPFLDHPTQTYTWQVEDALPEVAARAANSTYTPSSGMLSTKREDMKIIGGECIVDQAIVKMHGMERRAWDVAAKVKAISRYVGYMLLEGDTSSSGNPLGFDGLKVKTPTTGDQALDIGSGSAPSLKKIDALYNMVDAPTHWVMNKATELNLRAFLRGGGSGAAAVQIARNEFGQPLSEYMGLPILISDRTGTLATLGFTEASSTSSLFCVSIGPSGWHGIQNPTGLEVEDHGKSPTSPIYITRLEWLCSHVIENPRAVARGFNFTNATAVA